LLLTLPLVISLIVNTAGYVREEPRIGQETVLTIWSEADVGGDLSYHLISWSGHPREGDRSFEISKEVYESLSVYSIIYVIGQRRFFGWNHYVVLEDQIYDYLNDAE